MRRIAITLLFLLTLVLQSPSRAQGELPPVIRPGDVFTDAVEVVETLPIMNIQEYERKFYYLGPGAQTWIILPFPPGLTQIKAEFERTDGTYLISGESAPWREIPHQEVAKLWLVDGKAGRISRPEAACNMVKALPGEGEWVLVRQSEKGPYALCFTENGEMSAPLPEKLQPDLCGNTLGLEGNALSPDKRWIIFRDCKWPNFSLYSYQVATGQVTYLGTNPHGDDERVEVLRWADNTHPILFSQMNMNDSTRSLFVADVTRGNSLETIISGPFPSTVPVAQFFDDPPRYSWVPAEFGISSGDLSKENCQLHEFSLVTLKTTVNPRLIPGVCGLGRLITDGAGDRLYRSIIDFRRGRTSLIRFNLSTGFAKTLYEGEIEWIESVSPGGKYAELLLDNDGRILDDRGFLHPMSSYYPEENLKSPHMAIVHLKTGQAVYQTRLTPRMASGPYDSEYLFPLLYWSTGNSFVLFEDLYRDVTPQFDPGATLVKIVGGKVSETKLHYPDILFNLTRRLLVIRPDEIHRYAIPDPRTKKVIPIVGEVDANQRVDAYVQDDDAILISIVDLNWTLDREFVVGKWRIRLKGDIF